MPNIIREVKILGAESFLALTDTPSAFTGQGGKFVMVDPSEQRLVYQDTRAPEGLIGNWVMLAAAQTPNATQMSVNDLTPNATLEFTLHNTDNTSDRTDLLHYLLPGDGLRISAQVGAAQDFYNITQVDITDPDRTVLTVTYDNGTGTPFVVGQNYNIYSSVLVQITAPIVTFRGLRADPPNAKNGWVYFNETTQKLRLYAAGAWVDIN